MEPIRGVYIREGQQVGTLVTSGKKIQQEQSHQVQPLILELE